MSGRRIQRSEPFDCKVVKHRVIVETETVSPPGGVVATEERSFRGCSGMNECKIFSSMVPGLPPPRGCPFYDTYCR
jgi:hypothetical protein